MNPVPVEVDTPVGPARFTFDLADDPAALIVLGHGAGGGITAMDLDLLARRLPPLGVSVVRFEQPWRLAGRKIAVRPPQLDEAWLAAVGWLRTQPYAQDVLILGGRSAGARVACRTADALGADGVVALAFPLHLPGQPAKSRLPELLAPAVPRLVLQGTRDTFGTAAELRRDIEGTPGITLVELPGVDHGYKTVAGAAFTPADLRATLVERVTGFVVGIVGG